MTLDMNKPILFILYISIGCFVGFIGGIVFGTTYQNNVVLETVSQNYEVQKLMDWYQLIVQDNIVLEQLAEIKNMSDIDYLKAKYKRNGLSHVKLFRKQAEAIKKDKTNTPAILSLETDVTKIEKSFQQEQP